MTQETTEPQTQAIENDELVNERIIVKRYANRKLYNTRTSSYVTLSEIGRMVHDGEDVCIVDYKTQEDITSATLAQIIFEKEKSQKRLSPQALRDIIQSGGEVIQEFLHKRVLPVSIKEEAEKRASAFEKLVHVGSFSRDDVARLAREVLHSSQQNLEDIQKRVDERVRAALGPMTNITQLRRDLDAMKIEVEQLSAKLGELEKLVSERDEAE